MVISSGDGFNFKFSFWLIINGRFEYISDDEATGKKWIRLNKILGHLTNHHHGQTSISSFIIEITPEILIEII